MPRVTVETVDHVARLARLSLTDEEKQLFARQLEEILAWAESLQALDTSGVPSMSQPRDAASLREDEPCGSLERETVLEEAPDAAEGLFRVPRVLGG
jgi:aspartyl-tRNA(Asn)/glutamyl-tRNA(Gln) amidotransferase subunit C